MLNQPIMAGAGPIHHVLGMTHEYRMLPGTGLGLVLEATVPPGLGAPPHSHDADEELFYVLSGELTVELDGATHLLSPGDSCFLPLGSVHSFSNQSEDEVKFLAIVTPGTDAYAFFTEMNALPADQPLVPESIVAAGSANGLIFA